MGKETYNSAFAMSIPTAALRPEVEGPISNEQLQAEVQRLALRLRAAHKHVIKAVWNKLRLWQCEMALERWIEAVVAQQRREQRARMSASKGALSGVSNQSRARVSSHKDLRVDTAFREGQHKGANANHSSHSYSGGRSSERSGGRSGERSSGRRSDSERSSGQRSDGERSSRCNTGGRSGKRSSGNGAGSSLSYTRSGSHASSRSNSREVSPCGTFTPNMAANSTANWTANSAANAANVQESNSAKARKASWRVK